MKLAREAATSAAPVQDQDQVDHSGSNENTLVAIMFFAAGIVFLDRFGIAYLFPQIGRSLNVDYTHLGGLIAITAVFWALSSLIFSILSDRFGGLNKPIIVSSLVLFSLAVGCVGLAHSYGQMLALRAFIGFCEGPAMPLIQAAVARASSPHRRGRNIGIVTAGTAFIGTALAPVIMIGLGQAVGWRWAFVFVTFPGLVIAALVAIFMRRLPPNDNNAPRRVGLREFGQVVLERNVALSLVNSVICIATVIGTVAFTPLFLDRAGLRPSTQTLVLTVYGIVGATGTFLTPWLSDRIGRRPALRAAAVCAMLQPLFLVLFVHNIPLLLATMVVSLLGAGILPLSVYVVPGEAVGPGLTASAFALQLAVGETIGGVTGPALGGVLADHTHSVASALLFYAAAPVVILITSVFLRETAPRRTAAATAAAAATLV